MAKHTTHKTTTYGKATTLARKAARQGKRAGSSLDFERLARDLGAVVA